MSVDFGNIIRRLRKAAGMSQMKLAERIGISYQQVQKYEYGTSKLTIDRLHQICKALNVSIITFFEDADNAIEKASTANITPDEHILLQHYRRIKNPRLRKGFNKMAKEIAEINDSIES